MVLAAREQKMREVFVPAVTGAEAALVSDLEVIGVSSLVQLVQHLSGVERIAPVERNGEHPAPVTYSADPTEGKREPCHASHRSPA